MENASKALIIAGTILIVMILIAAGMFLFSRSGNLGLTVRNNLSEDEIKAFNQKFLKYEGEQKGSRVKELIAIVNKSNSENDVKVSISGFVNIDSKNVYYANSALINTNNYNVDISLPDGIVETITITEIK